MIIAFPMIEYEVDGIWYEIHPEIDPEAVVKAASRWASVGCMMRVTSPDGTRSVEFMAVIGDIGDDDWRDHPFTHALIVVTYWYWWYSEFIPITG